MTWDARGPVDWQAFAQGEYVGHARSAHVPQYRIRVDDQIAFIFRLTREVTGKPYELQVGDSIRVESLTGDNDRAGIGTPGQACETTFFATSSSSPTARSACRCWARCVLPG